MESISVIFIALQDRRRVLLERSWEQILLLKSISYLVKISSPKGEWMDDALFLSFFLNRISDT